MKTSFNYFKNKKLFTESKRLFLDAPNEGSARPKEAAEAAEKIVDVLGKQFLYHLSRNPNEAKAYKKMTPDKRKNDIEKWLKNPAMSESGSGIEKRSSFNVATNSESETYLLKGKVIDTAEYATKIYDQLYRPGGLVETARGNLAQAQQRPTPKPAEVYTDKPDPKEVGTDKDEKDTNYQWLEKWQLNLARNVYPNAKSVLEKYIQKHVIGSNFDLSNREGTGGLTNEQKKENLVNIKRVANNYLNDMGFYASIEEKGTVTSRVYCFDKSSLPRNKSGSSIVNGLENELRKAFPRG